MAKADLRIDWATHEAARYAVENWHYSRSMPVGKTVKIGAWEANRFIGAVVFAYGANNNMAKPYALEQQHCCELVRVALALHSVPASRIVALALRWLKNANPGLRLVVSYADTGQGHHGGIYQAGGWVYASGTETHAYRVNGVLVHPKTLHSRYGKVGQLIPWLRENVDPLSERVNAGFKHRYLMPLDEAMRTQIAPLAKPYPKRAKELAGEHPSPQGGVTPTCTLQSVNHGP